MISCIIREIRGLQGRALFDQLVLLISTILKQNVVLSVLYCILIILSSTTVLALVILQNHNSKVGQRTGL
jgi:hypothetical protein